tara:strand:+ start:78 stop:455 length:378 start_codon:yes stop_codon:yes gene_type:complete
MVCDDFRLSVAVESELALVLYRIPAPVFPLLYNCAVISREPGISNPVINYFRDSNPPGDLMLSSGFKVDSHSDAQNRTNHYITAFMISAAACGTMLLPAPRKAPTLLDNPSTRGKSSGSVGISRI